MVVAASTGSGAVRMKPATSSLRPPTASRRRSVALLNSRIDSDDWLAASLTRDIASRIWSAPCDCTRMPSVT